MDGIRRQAEHAFIDTAPRPTPSTFVHAAQISSLALTLRVLQPLLSREDVTEICINRPGEAFLETRLGWERETLPFADFHWCYRLAKLVANATRQRITEESPLLSAALPTGERIQIVVPPATPPSCVAITIRKPASVVWSVREMAAGRHLSHHPPRFRCVGCHRARAPRLARRPRLRGLYGARGASQEKHHRVRCDRERKDDLHQGVDSRDPARGAPHHD